MKLKEVCTETGLTAKTIRFYEEKQLITPNVCLKNGRSYRDYSEENVTALKEIAVLRKAMFSLDEIYLMQHEPDKIENVLSDYSLRILESAKLLNQLERTVHELDASAYTSVTQVAQRMQDATETMPLPSYDIDPHFRELEAEELAQLDAKQRRQNNRRRENPFPINLFSFTVRKKLFDEYVPYDPLLKGGSSNFPKMQESKGLRAVQMILSGLIVVLTLVILFFIQQRKIKYVNTWNEIKGYVIPLDVALLAVRLVLGDFLKLIRGIKNQVKLDKGCLMKCMIALCVVICTVSWSIFAKAPASKEQPDATMVLCCMQTFTEEEKEALSHMLEDKLEDYNQDGKTVAGIETLNFSHQSNMDKLKVLISQGGIVLYLFDEPSLNLFREQVEELAELEFIPPDNGIDFSDAQFISQLGLEDETITGCVLDTGNTKNGTIALEVLEQLSEGYLAFWYPK